MKRDLPTVTLLGIDCVNFDRLSMAAEICMKDFKFADVKLLTSLPTNNLHAVQINHIPTVEEYSRFVISELNDYVATEHVLIIQYDGFILNPAAWTDDFLQFDYIGSPLEIYQAAIRVFDLDPATDGDLVVGNGGFCLKSKKLLQVLASMSQAGKISDYHPEDIVICIKIREELETRGITFAPIELAERFSFEHSTATSDRWTDEFGFHGLVWSDISAWLKEHPQYNIQNIVNRDQYFSEP